MCRLVILQFFAYFCITQQENASLNELIQIVFNNGTLHRNPPTGTTAEAPSDGCTCVPLYLCNNGRVNKNGIGIIDIRMKHDNPCGSYLEVCCSNDAITERPITHKPKRRRGCGYRNFEGTGFHITGDSNNEAQFGEFPWMVAILRENTTDGGSYKSHYYHCGGSLIHPKAVVTAAHCVGEKNMKFIVRAGEWDTQTKEELYPTQDRKVSSIIVHPRYNGSPLYYNDIAVLILDSPMEMEENVDIICLPPQGTNVDGSRCIATGWGKDVFGKVGRYQTILKKIDLPILSHSTCQTRLRNTRLGVFFRLDPSFICAGGEGKDTCTGDGGGPLVCPIPGHDNIYQQAGIVAWGIGCGESQVPGAYVNVAMFRNWIDEQMISNKLDISYQH